MNYEEDERLEQLAAEYVIGTLQGQARARFERLRSESLLAQQAVWRWEAKLNPLATALNDVPPPGRVWRKIESAILAKSQDAKLKRWRWWGGLSTAAIVLLAAILFTPVEPGPSHVAQVNDAEAQPLWLIGVNLEDGTLDVRAVNAQAAEIDRAYELWMLPQEGPPRSLGLLPVNAGETKQQLPPGLSALLRSAQGLAVSIEPAGGSPTGTPTGPVVYTTELLKL